MWIFTPIGFFSIVENFHNKKQVLVRARVRSDLVRLREAVPGLSKITTTPNSDYRYRVSGLKSVVAAGIGRLILTDLNYHNFKGEVMERQGANREYAYMQVWQVLRDELGYQDGRETRDLKN